MGRSSRCAHAPDPAVSEVHPAPRRGNDTKEIAVQRFIIEREIPGASELTPEQLAEVAQTSNEAVASLGVPYTWVTSYVAGDKIYCVHDAPSEDLIRTHAEQSGFPANRITPVSAVISPATGEGG